MADRGLNKRSARHRPYPRRHPSTDKPHTSNGRATVRWSQGLAAAGVAAAILYSVVRFLLNNFYEDLGVTPEEIGWDLERTLVTFAPALLLFPTLVLVAFGMWFTDAWLSWRRSTSLLVISLIAVAFLVAAGFYYDAKANRVRVGQNPYEPPLLPINVPCVEVHPIGGDVVDINHGHVPRGKLMLLGNSDGLYYLFEPDADILITVPTSGYTTSSIPCGD